VWHGRSTAPLSGAAALHGVVSLGSDPGGAGTLTPVALRIAERGSRTAHVELGILPEADRIAGEGPTRILVVGYHDWFFYAPARGVTGCSSSWTTSW
jgi:hypothetical protein